MDEVDKRKKAIIAYVSMETYAKVKEIKTNYGITVTMLLSLALERMLDEIEANRDIVLKVKQNDHSSNQKE